VLCCYYYLGLWDDIAEKRKDAMRKCILFPCLLVIMPLAKLPSFMKRVREFYDIMFEDRR
jgi:hypothetical protein